MKKNQSVITNMLICINLVIMFIMMSVNFYTHNHISIGQEALVNFGGIIPQQSSYFTVISSMFLHAGMFHIAMNMLTLKILGSEIEKIFGRIFLPFYLLSGIMAGLGAYFFGSQNALIIGASGAICGIFGAKIVHVFKYGSKNDGKKGIMVDVVILLGLGFIPGISGISHFVGLVSGIVFALIFFNLKDTISDKEIAEKQDKNLTNFKEPSVKIN